MLLQSKDEQNKTTKVVACIKKNDYMIRNDFLLSNDKNIS
jgi:hypothetical protein